MWIPTQQKLIICLLADFLVEGYGASAMLSADFMTVFEI
jgi:hypothetical protein